MHRTIYKITALLLLAGVWPAAATLDPPPVGPFNNGYGDFSVLAPEPGETACQYVAAFPGNDPVDFLEAAAKVLNGRRFGSRGSVIGDANTNNTAQSVTQTNGVVRHDAKMTGNGMDGTLKFRFETFEEAEQMQELLNTFRRYMNPHFDCTTGTVDLPVPVTLTIAGVEYRADGGSATCNFNFIPLGEPAEPGPPPKEELESYKVFLRSAGRIYGAVRIQGLGNDVTGDATQPAQQFGPNEDNGLYTAKFGGLNVNGAFTFRFTKKKQSLDFRDFLEFFKRYFNPDLESCSGGNGFWVTIPPPSCILGCEVYAPAEFLPLRHITNLTDYDDILDIPGCRTYSCCCFAEQTGNTWEQDQCACTAEIAEVV